MAEAGIQTELRTDFNKITVIKSWYLFLFVRSFVPSRRDITYVQTKLKRTIKKRTGGHLPVWEGQAAAYISLAWNSSALACWGDPEHTARGSGGRHPNRIKYGLLLSPCNKIADICFFVRPFIPRDVTWEQTKLKRTIKERTGGHIRRQSRISKSCVFCLLSISHLLMEFSHGTTLVQWMVFFLLKILLKLSA